MYFWTECQNQGSIYNNINTLITHIGLLFCFLAGLVAGFRAGMFIMGCVCLWGKQLMWKSFIFINPSITECQQRPMTCNIFTEAGRREQAVASFSFICHYWRQRNICKRHLLAPGFKLRELLPLSIEITQGMSEPLTRLIQLPMLDGLNIPPTLSLAQKFPNVWLLQDFLLKRVSERSSNL